MPEAEDDVAPLPQDPLVGEGGVALPGEPDGAADALDGGGGEAGDPAARGGRLPDPPMVVWGKRIRRTGIVAFVLNTVGFFGVLFEAVQDYPYLPIALGCALAAWTGRVMIVKARQTAEPPPAG